MLMPVVCPLCRGLGEAPCQPCRSSLPKSGSLARVDGLDSLLACFDYTGTTVPLIGAIKYRNERAAVTWVAGEMAALLNEPVDLVTWAPTSPSRRRERGFDQAHLLASAVGSAAEIRVRSMLRRRAGSAQTGRSREERLDGVEFAARRTRARTVVVVDDVVTSGATLRAAAFALREKGVNRVIGLVAARTPVRVG